MTIYAADIEDFDEAVSLNPDVAANTAARHDEAHAILDSDDHSDVDDATAAAAGQVLGYGVDSYWHPTTLRATANGGTWT